MKVHKWKDVRARSKLTAQDRAEVDREVQAELLEMSLREMRELAGTTQVELANKMQRAQGEISKLERRDDFFLSTLREYIEALGGDLEIVARFGDKAIRLRGV